MKKVSNKKVEEFITLAGLIYAVSIDNMREEVINKLTEEEQKAIRTFADRAGIAEDGLTNEDLVQGYIRLFKKYAAMHPVKAN